VTVLLFNEGRAFVVIEAVSRLQEPAPRASTIGIGQTQAPAIKRRLAG
jgi:hypothetical protein